MYTFTRKCVAYHLFYTFAGEFSNYIHFLEIVYSDGLNTCWLTYSIYMHMQWVFSK